MFTQHVLPEGFSTNILGSKLRSTNIAEPNSISSEDFFLKQKLKIRIYRIIRVRTVETCRESVVLVREILLEWQKFD